MELLLERGAELGKLESVVSGAAEGRGGLVLIGGEAGIGKTSLLSALREMVGSDSFFLGGCEPLSVPVPLAPLRELLEAAGEPTPQGWGQGDRLAIAKGVLGAVSSQAPAVAAVEDVHWADPSTLDVLRLLARRLDREHVVLALTYRSDEVGTNPALRRFLGDWAGRPSVTRVLPTPLSAAAVRELAEPTGLDASGLAEATGGNPFLVTEALASGERLPASVRDAALARVDRLGSAAREVVTAAAVVGRRVDPHLLEALAPERHAALEEALARGVIVAEGRLLGFRHELIREAIEESIAPPRRAELHRRTYEVLAADPAGAGDARLAHHAEAGGMDAAGARHAALAAAEAERVGAMRETSMQASRALRLGRSMDPPERFELLLQQSRSANFASVRVEDAVQPAEAAIGLARELGDPVREARALLALASALWSLDRPLEARGAVDRAIELLDPRDQVPWLARAQAASLRIEATALDPRAALADGDRARELAALAELEEGRVDVEVSIGLALGHAGDPEALTVLERASQDARDARLAIQTVRAFVNRVFVAGMLRRHADLDLAAAEALELFDEHQATIPSHVVELYQARSRMDRGDWDVALATLRRGDREWASETAVARGLAALIDSRRGAPGSRPELEDAWRMVDDLPEGSRHGTLRVALVEAAWLRGTEAEARAHLEAALSSPATPRFARSAGDLAVWAARLGLDVPAPAGAPEAVALELEGDWRAAVTAWRELDAPYDAALAALAGDERAAREAVAALRRLGGGAAAEAFVRHRGSRGGRALRGPRRSTLANAAGLTRRQQEVLSLLATGATNSAIAEALHLSPRTVDHHVAAILAKLEVRNRTAAVERALERGLLGRR